MGEDDKKEEITPEMIQAGVAALRRYDEFLSLPPSLEPALVRDVLRAVFERGQEDPF